MDRGGVRTMTIGGVRIFNLKPHRYARFVNKYGYLPFCQVCGKFLGVNDEVLNKPSNRDLFYHVACAKERDIV
jgi:hypothetical protein